MERSPTLSQSHFRKVREIIIDEEMPPIGQGQVCKKWRVILVTAEKDSLRVGMILRELMNGHLSLAQSHCQSVTDVPLLLTRCPLLWWAHVSLPH